MVIVLVFSFFSFRQSFSSVRRVFEILLEEKSPFHGLHINTREQHVYAIVPETVLGLRDFYSMCPAGIWCKNDVVLTLMRRDDVASTLIRRHFRTKCPLGVGATVFPKICLRLRDFT